MPSEEDIQDILQRDVLEDDNYVFFASHEAVQHYLPRKNIKAPQRTVLAMEPGETIRLRTFYGLHPEDKIFVFLYQKPWQYYPLSFLYKTKNEGWKAKLDNIMVKDAIHLIGREEIRKAIWASAEQDLENLYSQEENILENFLEIRGRTFHDMNMKLLHIDDYKGPFSEPKSEF